MVGKDSAHTVAGDKLHEIVRNDGSYEGQFGYELAYDWIIVQKTYPCEASQLSSEIALETPSAGVC